MKKYLLPFLFLFLFLASCGDDDDNMDDDNTIETGAQSITCDIDGATFTAADFQASLSKSTDSASGLEFKRVQITGTASTGERIILTLQDLSEDKNADCPEVVSYHQNTGINTCDTIPGTSTLVCSGMQGLYLVNIQEQYFSETNGTGNGVVVITECDEANRKLSGTFTFVGELPNSSLSVNVTNGSFQNVNYTIQ